jgi:hypothetical protein
MDVHRHHAEPPGPAILDFQRKDQGGDRRAKGELPVVVDDVAGVGQHDAVSMALDGLNHMGQVTMNDIDAAQLRSRGRSGSGRSSLDAKGESSGTDIPAVLGPAAAVRAPPS